MMATGSYDENGFYTYGEDDLADPGQGFSELLNKSANGVKAAVPVLVHNRVLDELQSDDTIRQAAVEAVDVEVTTRELAQWERWQSPEVATGQYDADGNLSPFATDPRGRVYHPARTILAEDIAGMYEPAFTDPPTSVASVDANGNASPFAVDDRGRVLREARATLAEDIAGFTDTPFTDPPIDAAWAYVDSASNLLLAQRYDGTLINPGAPAVPPGDEEPEDERDEMSALTVVEVVAGETWLMDRGSGRRTRLVPVDRTRLITPGSSTFAGLDFAGWAATKGIAHLGGANGGILIEHQLARFGSRPLVASAGFVIPASGTVSVTSTNVSPSLYNAFSMAGYFLGFENRPGVLSKPGGGGAPAWTFTPDGNGISATVDAGTPFISTLTSHSDALIIAQLGKNNGTGVGGGTQNVDDVIRWTDEAYEFAASSGKYMLLVNHHIDTFTPAISAERTWLETYNAHLASHRRRCVDLGGWVGSTAPFDALGITPDEADRAEIALGNKAPQISAYSSGSWPTGTVDPLHLSLPARPHALAFITSRLSTLNWI